jgi:hypothetical protein
MPGSRRVVKEPSPGAAALKLSPASPRITALKLERPSGSFKRNSSRSHRTAMYVVDALHELAPGAIRQY